MKWRSAIDLSTSNRGSGQTRALGFLPTKFPKNISKKTLLSVLFAFVIIPSVATADDELFEAKPALMWLSNSTQISVFDTNTAYDSFVGKGEFGIDNWSISANLLQNQDNDVFGLPENSEFFNLDVKRRFGKKNKSNLELGLGWQKLNIESQLEASGPKLSLTGQLNILSSIQLFGSTAYYPSLEDNLQSNDATAFEFEAGVLYQPLPSLSLKAGYRIFSLDLENSDIEELGSSSGFLLGTDWSW